MIIISLDYDNCFTLAPEMWFNFIKNAPPSVKIVCCTMRWEGEADSMDPRLLELVEVFFTARQAKRAFLENLGISVHIWIDDTPEAILEDFL